MKISPTPSRKALLGFLPFAVLLVGQFGFRMADTMVQSGAEVAPQERWEKGNWRDMNFLSPGGWKRQTTDNEQLTFLPDNSMDSDKTQITVSAIPNEDFGMRATMERYIKQDIGAEKMVSISDMRETHLGHGYDGLMQRVTTKNARGESVYHWYFLMEAGKQNRMVRFTAETPRRQNRYQKDFNRFLNNISFENAPTYQGPVINPADYYEGRQIATGDDPSRG